MNKEKSLREQVLDGEDSRLQLLAAQGLLPTEPEELVQLQARLVRSKDRQVALAAHKSLSAYESGWIFDLLRTSGDRYVIDYYARTGEGQVRTAVLLNRGLTPELAVLLAPSLSDEHQELLLLRQDLLKQSPKLLDALARNENLSRFAKRRIFEYRRHLYLPAPGSAAQRAQEIAETIAESDAQASDDDQIDMALELEKVIEDVEQKGDVCESTGLSEAQVRALPIPIKTKMARGATRTLRWILVRDPNPMVALAVIQHSAMTESEAELVSANRNVADDVLTAIINKREWVTKYRIMHNLVCNPKTPVGLAIRFVPRLGMRDLSLVSRDRNVSDAVRQAAMRLKKLRQN